MKSDIYIKLVDKADLQGVSSVAYLAISLLHPLPNTHNEVEKE